MSAKPEKNFFVGFVIACLLGLAGFLILFSAKTSEDIELPSQPVLDDNTAAFRTRLGVKQSELDDPLYAMRRNNPQIASSAESAVAVRNTQAGREGQGVLIGNGDMVLTSYELIGKSKSADVVTEAGEVILAKVAESREDLGFTLLVLPHSGGDGLPLVDATRMPLNNLYFVGSRDSVSGDPGASQISLVTAPVFVSGSPVPLLQLGQVPSGVGSGSPIFNADGEVIGLISTQWRSGGPTGIPANLAGQMQSVSGISHLLSEAFNAWQANGPS